MNRAVARVLEQIKCCLRYRGTRFLYALNINAALLNISFSLSGSSTKYCSFQREREREREREVHVCVSVCARVHAHSFFCVVNAQAKSVVKTQTKSAKNKTKMLPHIKQIENSPDKTDLKWNTRRQITEVTTCSLSWDLGYPTTRTCLSSVQVMHWNTVKKPNRWIRYKNAAYATQSCALLCTFNCLIYKSDPPTPPPTPSSIMIVAGPWVAVQAARFLRHLAMRCNG